MERAGHNTCPYYTLRSIVCVAILKFRSWSVAPIHMHGHMLSHDRMWAKEIANRLI